MDLTGSIADSTAPLSAEMLGSFAGGDITGSSFIDAIAMVLVLAPSFLLQIAADFGADLGSTMGT